MFYNVVLVTVIDASGILLTGSQTWVNITNDGVDFEDEFESQWSDSDPSQSFHGPTARWCY